jgi:hypothetical protein
MIAAAYWWGWVLAHPVTLLVWGALAILCVLGTAAYCHATSEDDPEAPRRGTRSRARGPRGRRHYPSVACRRARGIRAWVTSWFWWLDSDAGWHPWQAALERAPWARQAITQRIQGLRFEHHPAALLETGPPEQPETPANVCGHGWPGAACGQAHPYIPEPTRLATAAERDAAASPWEHDTSWFTLPAIDADVAAKDGA